MLSDHGPGARLEEWPDQAAAFNRGLVGWLLDMLQPSEPDGGPVQRRAPLAGDLGDPPDGEDQPLLPISVAATRSTTPTIVHRAEATQASDGFRDTGSTSGARPPLAFERPTGCR